MLPVLVISTMSDCHDCARFMDDELDDLINSLDDQVRLIRFHNSGGDIVPLAIRERAPITPGFLLFSGDEYAKYYDKLNRSIAEMKNPECFSYAVIEADPVSQRRVGLRFIPFKRTRSAPMVSAWTKRCIKNLDLAEDPVE